MSTWLITAHRDWQRLDTVQFPVSAATREEAVRIGKEQLGSAQWLEGLPYLVDEGFIVAPTDDPETAGTATPTEESA